MENFERNWKIEGNLEQLLSRLNLQSKNDTHKLTLINQLLVYTGYGISERFHEELKNYLQSKLKEELNLTLLHALTCAYLANAGDSIMLKFTESSSNYSCNLQIKLRCNKGLIRLEVDDNGKGIDKEIEPFLFSDAQKSTKRVLPENLMGILFGFDGYSLPQARHTTTRFNGRVGYQNKGDGNGAIFWYEIPVLGIPKARKSNTNLLS